MNYFDNFANEFFFATLESGVVQLYNFIDYSPTFLD